MYYRRQGPGAPWNKLAGGPPLDVPEFIWDSFGPPVAMHVIGRETVGGVPTTALSFFKGSQDSPVWFRLWVDGTGLVRRAQMRPPGHFMDHRYFDFNAPLAIKPPRL